MVFPDYRERNEKNEKPKHLLWRTVKVCIGKIAIRILRLVNKKTGAVNTPAS